MSLAVSQGWVDAPKPQRLTMGLRNMGGNRDYWESYYAQRKKEREEFLRARGVYVWHEGMDETEVQRINHLLRTDRPDALRRIELVEERWDEYVAAELANAN